MVDGISRIIPNSKRSFSVTLGVKQALNGPQHGRDAPVCTLDRFVGQASVGPFLISVGLV